jgi:hypothetical protein
LDLSKKHYGEALVCAVIREETIDMGARTGDNVQSVLYPV